MLDGVRKAINRCCCRSKGGVPQNRHIKVGNHGLTAEDIKQRKRYSSNRVVSSRYTLWNFLPKNLFEQFRRVANFYFLCVTIIGFSIDSPVSPYTTLIPLLLVIIVTGVKQGYEDYLRHIADREVNNAPAHIVRDDHIESVKSQHIHVGDIVRVGINCTIPCDMVMLSSSEDDGRCYITTANLDGEANLKVYHCLPQTRHLHETDDFKVFRANIECEQPTVDLYSFHGNLQLGDSNSGSNNNKADDRKHENGGPRENGYIELKRGQSHLATGLNSANLLLRGSRLKNTTYVYGCAVYTGQDTKISLNSRYKSHKFSRVEKGLNRYILIMLAWLLAQCALLTGLKHGYYGDRIKTGESMWYTVREPDVTFLVVLDEFLSYMVLLNYVIPISLYVTVELQKLFSSMCFIWDVEMYDQQSNEPAKANTSDLNEELGQVKYLFTDKTGTLTENDMQFRQCTVGGNKYREEGGILYPVVEDDPLAPQLQNVPDDLIDFFTVLALCHTVRVDCQDTMATGEFSTTGAEYEYQASSPDEKALLDVCRRHGVVYHGERDGRLVVGHRGELRHYERPHVLHFDPTRKRMSVIVRNESGELWVYVKGADTAVFNRIIDGDVDVIERHVSDFAELGLRTLVVARRRLTEEEFAQLDTQLLGASASVGGREEEMAAAYDAVERDFTLLGATGVEDRLQDEVPETIRALRAADIHVWVLTGDKEETAVNVSQAAGHFSEDMIPLRLCGHTDTERCRRELAELLDILRNGRAHGDTRLVIDGMSLALAMQDMEPELRELCMSVKTVLCCRLSPLQKALVVRMVKSGPDNPTTCAIGDGANDVSMIQEAHVGIGIMGKEGRNAVRASDYAFARFKFLKRAILLHGHYFYVRVAGLVQYFFYKNVAFITPQFYYCFFNAFSAQSMYDTLYLLLYNVTSTTLPILLYGFFEQSIRKDLLQRRPTLYRRISDNSLLSFGQFVKWCSLGLWHSLVFYFGTHFLFSSGEPIHTNGQMDGTFAFGTVVYTACVLVVNIKLMIYTRFWNGVVLFGFALTILGYFAIVLFYNNFIWYFIGSPFHLYGVFFRVMSNPTVWMTLLLLCVGALLPDLVIAGLEATFGRFKHIRVPLRVQLEPTNRLSISVTKRSGKLTISQTNLIEDNVVESTPL